MKLNTYNKGKLYLSKQAIATLSTAGLNDIKGGQHDARAWSTSIGKCTGVFCCDQHAPVPAPASDLIYYTAIK